MSRVSTQNTEAPEFRSRQEEESMNTQFTDRQIKLIWAMAIIMIPLVIDATIRLIELG